MRRMIGFVYGVTCYAIFFVTFLYLIAFLANFMVPKGIDGGVPTAAAPPCFVGLGLLTGHFVIDHFDLFGLRQVWLGLTGKPTEHQWFRVIYFYKFVRHPLYLGFLLAISCTPNMTLGHCSSRWECPSTS